MHKSYSWIGEHQFEIQADSANLMNMFARYFNCEAEKRSNFPVNMTVHIHGGYKVPSIQSNGNIPDNSCKRVFRQNDYLIDIQDQYQSADLYVYNGHALITAFNMLYSQYIISSGWGIMLHGKCAVSDGQTTILSELSGERIPENSSSGSDQEALTLIRISSANVSVFPNSGRLSSGKKQLCDPLIIDNIQLLQHSFLNKRIKVGRTNAVIQLLDFISFWPNDPEQMKNAISLLKQLVSFIPVYHQYFCSSEPAAV